jgi:4-hydroxy-tetrahydrodipicolinate synthase
VHFRGVASTKGGSSSGLGAFKATLHLRGIIDHPVTATPQIPLDRDEIARVKKYLAGAGLLKLLNLDH